MNEFEEIYERMKEIEQDMGGFVDQNEIVDYINEYALLQRKVLSTKEGRNFLIEKKIDIEKGLFLFMMADEELSDIESNATRVIDKENLDLARKESAQFFDEMVDEYVNSVDMNSKESIGKLVKRLERTFGLGVGTYRR